MRNIFTRWINRRKAHKQVSKQVELIEPLARARDVAQAQFNNFPTDDNRIKLDACERALESGHAMIVACKGLWLEEGQESDQQ